MVEELQISVRAIHDLERSIRVLELVRDSGFPNLRASLEPYGRASRT